MVQREKKRDPIDDTSRGEMVYLICLKQDKGSHGDDFGGSDEEEAPDAYLARVKAEGKERDAGNEANTSFPFKNCLNPTLFFLLLCFASLL